MNERIPFKIKKNEINEFNQMKIKKKLTDKCGYGPKRTEEPQMKISITISDMHYMSLYLFYFY